MRKIAGSITYQWEVRNIRRSEPWDPSQITHYADVVVIPEGRQEERAGIVVYNSNKCRWIGGPTVGGIIDEVREVAVALLNQLYPGGPTDEAVASHRAT